LEVDEMIQNRFEAEYIGSKENEQWPAVFWLEQVNISRNATSSLP
jgi:hypothetical protein